MKWFPDPVGHGNSDAMEKLWRRLNRAWSPIGRETRKPKSEQGMQIIFGVISSDAASLGDIQFALSVIYR